MSTLLVALLSALGFVVAYHTYGRWLARRVFGLDPAAPVPSRELADGHDYVATPREVVFGHHFTSIAGTGPIVGPAIAVFWGWLPALLWVVFGSIFIGAVHDLGALVVSVRSRGQTIGEVAARMISPRARLLFLTILFAALVVVIAIFGLVIAVLFARYPQAVLSIWVEIPLAVAIGLWIRRGRGRGLLWPSLAALGVLYLCIWIGVRWLPIGFGAGIPLFAPAGAGFVAGLRSAVVIWTALLLVYAFVASVLPVWALLQPRDYINSHELLVALALLLAGIVVARPDFVAPALNAHAPGDAPPLFPFLFITIACGAVSGFHCLVSSGTSSKQLARETDAQLVGYGAMLLEGGLAVVVIVACAAGLGLGAGDGGPTGVEAWQRYYKGSWEGMRLGDTVAAFVDGSGNLMAALGIARPFAIGIAAVMVASFAATTLDTATRLQRYVVQELAGSLRIPALGGKYAATLVAVGTGGALALFPGPQGPGSGGLILWPLFGATNQLLAGLAFVVIAFYLARHERPIGFLVIPAGLLLALPAWAMVTQIAGWARAGQWLLVLMGVGFEALQVWMVVEAALLWRGARGVLPAPLPPLDPGAPGPAGAPGAGAPAIARSA